MALLDCFEADCKAKISTKAKHCPQCGFPIEEYLEETLDKRIFCIPVSPFDYWVSWHIWYWRMQESKTLSISYTSRAWVYRCMKIMSIPGIVVESPVSGLFLDTKTLGLSMKKSQPDQSTYSSSSYVAIQLLKDQDIPEHVNLYPYLQDYLRSMVKRYEARKGIKKFFIPDVTNGAGLDPKDQFSNVTELLEKVDDLANVRPVILDI